jgi:hypothetical protein
MINGMIPYLDVFLDMGYLAEEDGLEELWDDLSGDCGHMGSG